MKPNHLFTSMLALATIVVTSCSAPRMAQQSTIDDDVYNTTAKAKIYTPAPVKPSQQTPSVTDEEYAESDYYGTSDPYYDMDYSSRINRFYYSSPWRNYYDPYFYSGWYPQNGWSIGFGYSPFYNNYWNSPYGGWGFASSPFWGWNNWGWNNFYGGGFYGGGFLGGGFYGGGYYGGGFYTGRTTNVPDYRSRPGLGRENGVGSYRNSLGRPSNGRAAGRSDADGNVISRQTRAERYAAENGNPGAPGRTSNRRTQETAQPADNRRPARTETAPPARQPESRPSYSPPPSRSSGSGSGSSGSGSSGGGSRTGRAGRG